ncbi:MAG: helix-turn-helix domain-containing protein [Candidatus Thorarchaeota archaeon]
MSKDPDDASKDKIGVVDELLEELGVDDSLKKELIDSGRLHTDVFMVESAEQVRRRLEIERSAERLRDSLVLLERNMMNVDATVDRVERDLVPVVLSFLVGLKGNLVNLRTTIVGRSKRRAKTNLQATYVDTEVKSIVDEEFEKVEETLTSGMSAPIMEKVKDITDGLKGSMKTTFEEMSTLKSSVDGFTQRATTELEFLSKELLMKPKEVTTQDVLKQIKDLERQVEELTRDLGVSEERLKNREEEISRIQSDYTEAKAKEDALEEQIAKLKATPQVDADMVVELRQSVKSLEAERDLLAKKAGEEESRADGIEKSLTEQRELVAKRDIEIGDLKAQVAGLQEQIATSKEQLLEVDDLRARLRSYESGDKMRELERLQSEHERINATLERLKKDHSKTLARLNYTELRLEGYLGLMEATDKTRAFLMVEENNQMPIRAIARSLGVSEPIVRKWVEDYQRLGIVTVKDDGQTLELALTKIVLDEDE